MIRFHKATSFRSTATIALIIFVSTLAIFLISRVRQVTDSAYSMMLSQSLLDHRTFTLDHYTFPPIINSNTLTDILITSCHPVVRCFPHPPCGSLTGLAFPRSSRRHLQSPRRMENRSRFGCSLMAILAVIFFFTARLVLAGMERSSRCGRRSALKSTAPPHEPYGVRPGAFSCWVW